MPSASAIRLQIEAALAHRIPSALTPPYRAIRPTMPTGVAAVDALLEGGLPLGAISEFVGSECSGRTSLALSFLAGITRAESVVAWIDVCDALDPESAAASGIDLSRLLWVRCGVEAKQAQIATGDTFHLPDKFFVAPPPIEGLHGGGCGAHPRAEMKGLAGAVGTFLHSESLAPASTRQQRHTHPEREITTHNSPARMRSQMGNAKPWQRIEQALRVADLLLNAGGFAAVVLDMAGIAPEYASRIPLATWFRYRAAVERAQSILLLLTQYPCAKSSGELLLRFPPGEAPNDESTVFTGMGYRALLEHQRFTNPAANVVSIRKPPQRETAATWRSQSTWAGAR